MLSVAPDEVFFPFCNAIYYSARPKPPGIVCALLPCHDTDLVEIPCSLDTVGEFLVLF